MRILSLFSGIGGLDLGIKLALPEARVVGYVEKDDYCQRVLRARMADGWLDEAPIHGDITTFDGTGWRGAVDLICGGFPCQDISNAGKREGIKEGNRSGLWWEFARVIREVGPRYVFVENVAALLGRGMDVVLGELSNLGFNAEWGVFSAAEVGASHLRKRLFLLAYLCGEGLEERQSAGRESQRQAMWGHQAGPADLYFAMAHAAHFGYERRGSAWRRGDGSADGIGTMADACHDDSECLARFGAGSGEAAIGRPCCGIAGCGLLLADAESQCGELRSAEGERPGRLTGSGSSLENADDAGSSPGRTSEPDEACSNVSVGPSGGRCFPPGPADRDAWERVLQDDPTLEPSIRGVAARVPGRVDRLRSLGNAVVPLVSAYALRTLAARMECS